MVVGEFNGDGRPDLAVANASNINAGVNVLLGNGDGTFQAMLHFPTGNSPRSVAVGDVHGDGRLDLAVPDGNHVNILLGNGDGTFQAPRTFLAGREPRSVAVGDVNGDGRLDLAVANYGNPAPPFANGSVGVLLGNGDGTFQGASNYSAGLRPTSVAVSDVSGDGRLDLVVTNFGDFPATVSVLLGNGNGGFETAQSFTSGLGSRSVAVGDVNGDSFPDLAVANNSQSVPTVSVLRNDGYWGGPTASFYIYPASGTVTAGQPFDVYVIPLNASFEIVTNYTGLILFWATDAQATTPIYYQFRLSDRGIASFPGGLTFNTLGFQELYVFDWPAIQVWGYAAFDVVGAAPGASGGGAGGAPDLFIGQELARDHGSLVHRQLESEGVSSAELRQTASGAFRSDWPALPAETAKTNLATYLGQASAGSRALFDHLFAKVDELVPAGMSF